MDIDMNIDMDIDMDMDMMLIKEEDLLTTRTTKICLLLVHRTSLDRLSTVTSTSMDMSLLLSKDNSKSHQSVILTCHHIK